MIKAILSISGLMMGLITVTIPASSQMYGDNEKDNTRPETTARISSPAFIRSFTAIRGNGNNVIEWTAVSVSDTRKFIIEYSTNGVDYLTAGELMADKELYNLKHQLLDDRPMVYRILMEQLNGKLFYSPSIILDGVPVSPVTIYPTVITGNMVNINTRWPVERIVVTAANGTQVLTKEINGQRDYMTVSIPVVGKGMYRMSFYGQGWRTTEKFVVQ